MEKGTWSLFPCAPDGLRRVREAVLVTRQKTPNASTATIAQQNVAKQKDRGTYHPRGVVFVGFVKRSSSPAKNPLTHRPQQSLSKRRETKGPRNVPSALVTRPVLDGGLRGRCARWDEMMRVDSWVSVAW